MPDLVGDHAVVAVQRELDASAEDAAVDRGHGRVRKLADACEEVVSRAAALDRVLAGLDAWKLVEVGAAGEAPGLPVMTRAEKRLSSSSGRSRASDSSAPRPRMFGRPARVPSSIVTSATESRRSRWNWVTGSPTEPGYLPARVRLGRASSPGKSSRYEDGEARAAGRPRRAAAAADADGQRGRRRGARAAHGRARRRGVRVVPPRGRALPREHRRRSAGQLGPADRRDEGARSSPATGPKPRTPRAGRSSSAPPRRNPRSGATRPRSRLLVLGHDHDAVVHADAIRTGDGFPHDVGDALAFIAAGPSSVTPTPSRASSTRFETREEYLEDIPVADTVLVLQALAARRGIAAELSSSLLPATSAGA